MKVNPIGMVMDSGKSSASKKKVVVKELVRTAPMKKQSFKNPKLDNGTRPKQSEGVQRLKDLSRLGNPGVLGKLMAEHSAKKKKEAEGAEWSRLRRESPSTGKGVGY